MLKDNCNVAVGIKNYFICTKPIEDRKFLGMIKKFNSL